MDRGCNTGPDAGDAGRFSAENVMGMMARVADLAMLVDGGDGMVCDAALGSERLADVGLDRLVGRRLSDLVTSESQEKVTALLAGGAADGRWRHVNFPVADGADVPVSLQMLQLGDGRLLAVGRDHQQTATLQRRFIKAQHELEESHARLRQADLRFHTMLALSDLAVLTLDGDTLRIIEANEAAATQLGRRPDELAGQPFPALLDEGAAEAGRRALEDVRATGRIAGFQARLRGRGEQRFQAALFRYEQRTRLLVRLVVEPPPAESDTYGLIAELPHPVVFTDPALHILRVNRAFADLAQLSVAASAVGEPLARFVGRNGVDTSILAAALADQPVVRDFATTLTGVFGTVTGVDVDAVAVGTGSARQFGFMLRSAARRTRPLNAAERGGLVDRMTDVVGRVALKEIVRDTTDVIEKLCIETALGMTDNNRAAASDMLGISRQSLYAKLARYGIGGDKEDE